MNFDDLIDLYMTSDIAMITPVRDGMNLVAKEFVATRVSGDGVLILSEMAGASKELFEAVLVNPFDRHAMADALLHAITMPMDEQKRRNAEMQKRLRRYSVEHWSQEFMRALQVHSDSKTDVNTPKIDAENQMKIVRAFQKTKRKAILLDYDGTLVPFHENPEAATPDQQLIELLQTLCKQPGTDLAIISGRDQSFMSRWLGDLPLTLVAEHGHYIKPKGKKMEKFLPWRQTMDERHHAHL